MPGIYAVGLCHDERTTRFRESDSFREQTANEQAQLASDPCSQYTFRNWIGEGSTRVGATTGAWTRQPSEGGPTSEAYRTLPRFTKA